MLVICLFIFSLFQTVQRHGVYSAAYDMQLLYHIVLIYSAALALTTNLDPIIMGIFHSFESENYVSKIRFKNIMSSLLLLRPL